MLLMFRLCLPFKPCYYLEAGCSTSDDCLVGLECQMVSGQPKCVVSISYVLKIIAKWNTMWAYTKVKVINFIANTGKVFIQKLKIA